MKHYEFKVILKAGKYEDNIAAYSDIINALDRLTDDEVINDYDVLSITEVEEEIDY